MSRPPSGCSSGPCRTKPRHDWAGVAMVAFFYGLPLWLATIVVLGTALGVGLGSSFGLRRLFRLHTSDDDMETAVSLMQVVAAYIGILIAFAGVQVWQDFSDAENAVHKEAAAASQLYRDMSTYGPQTVDARRELRAYVDSIVTDEWPLLSLGRSQPTNRGEVVRTVRRSRQNSSSGQPRQYDIHGNVFEPERPCRTTPRPVDSQQIGDADHPMGSRPVRIGPHRRLYGDLPKQPGQHVDDYRISLALGLVFLFILVVDRPFLGEFSVSSSELHALSGKFDLLDRLSGS